MQLHRWALAATCLAMTADMTLAACNTSGVCASSPVAIDPFSGSYTAAYDVSFDGSFVTGYAEYPFTFGNAYRWQGGSSIDLFGSLGVGGSAAQAISRDGQTIVGYYDTAPGVMAFRWQNGSRIDLGNLGGINSIAQDTNDTGSFVVGYSRTSGGQEHAFLWDGTMHDIHDASFGFDLSAAQGISADGSVIAGRLIDSMTSGQHAFRWEGGVMTDLSSIVGGSGRSGAAGLTADGQTIVGYSEVAGGSIHAARWNAGTWTDLGVLSGSTSSTALGVSDDARVIVGVSGAHAFRWTEQTSIRELNVLLQTAGVNMSGIDLAAANSVSGDGRYIVGNALFGGNPRGFVVLYDDSGAAVIAGLTNFSSQQASLNTLASAHVGVMAHQHGLASQLLGDDKPVEQGNEAGAFAAAGSATVGGYARYALAEGLELLAGVSYAREDYDMATIEDSVIGATRLRAISRSQGLRQFAEVGGWYAPKANLRFDRKYDNGAGVASASGNTTGDLSYYFGRVGLILPGNKNQLVASAELGQQYLKTDAYAEPLSSSNPFNAVFGEEVQSLSLAKARLSWSMQFDQRFDGTLWAAGVRGFNDDSDPIIARVAGFGGIEAKGDEPAEWLEYGVRVGYAPVTAVTLDVFANGVSGPGAIATRVHTGAGMRMKF